MRSLPPRGQHAIEIRIPLGSLAREVEDQLPKALAEADLPRGRRRAGWEAEMGRAFGEMTKQLGDVRTVEILGAVKAHRHGRRALPEVTVVANRALNTAWGCRRYAGTRRRDLRIPLWRSRVVESKRAVAAGLAGARHLCVDRLREYALPVQGRPAAVESAA